MTKTWEPLNPSVHTDVGDIIGDGNAAQVGASAECTVSNTGDTIRYHDVR